MMVRMMLLMLKVMNTIVLVSIVDMRMATMIAMLMTRMETYRGKKGSRVCTRVTPFRVDLNDVGNTRAVLSREDAARASEEEVKGRRSE